MSQQHSQKVEYPPEAKLMVVDKGACDQNEKCRPNRLLPSRVYLPLLRQQLEAHAARVVCALLVLIALTGGIRI